MTLIGVSKAALDDLEWRLTHTRWGTGWPTAGWDAGTDRVELHRLVEYWANEFEWSAQEAMINALPSEFAVIDGTPIHYLRFEGETPGALPIVLTHGWPSTFLELVDLGERLANPTRFGGTADDAFTVIIPSLPGFGFSPQRPTLLDAMPTHELWHHLMTDHLGFDRYAAHGGDLGAGITARLAEAYPREVVGIHVLAVADPAVPPTDLTAEEREFQQSQETWFANEGAYEHQQQTRPLTLAPALADSPVGLLSWIVEKYRGWSDNGGDLANSFSDDFILTQASLYWFTQTITTSFRPYYEYGRNGVPRVRRVEVPTAVAVFPADLTQPPRSWAERTYNVTRYTRMPRGGHFAAHEQPALLAADITEFYRGLR